MRLYLGGESVEPASICNCHWKTLYHKLYKFANDKKLLTNAKVGLTHASSGHQTA